LERDAIGKEEKEEARLVHGLNTNTPEATMTSDTKLKKKKRRLDADNDGESTQMSKKLKKKKKLRSNDANHLAKLDGETRKIKHAVDGTGTESVKLSEFGRIRNGIQRDPRVRDLLDIADSVAISPTLIDELREMFVTSRDNRHGTYSFSGVDSTFKNPRKNAIKIAELLLVIQAHRDRAVNIQLDLFTFLDKITKARRVIREVMHEQFGVELKKVGALPVQAVLNESVMERLNEKKDTVEMYLNITDRILKNLDNSYFSFREAGIRGESVMSRAEGAFGGRN
jgi:hypothetical protein